MASRTAAEQAGKTDGFPKEETKMQSKPATKSDISRGLIGRIPEGGELRTKNGSLTITRGVDSGFLWKDVNRTDADPLNVDQTIKRLAERYKLDILSNPDTFAVFGSHDEGEDAQQTHDQTVRDRVVPEAVQEIRTRKAASANKANARKAANGAARKTKEREPAPEGFEYVSGSDIKPGSVFIRNPKIGPVKMVERHEVMMEGRPRLRLVLCEVEDERVRWGKYISPTKEYPVRSAK